MPDKPSLKDMAERDRQTLLNNAEMRFVHRRLTRGLEYVIERKDDAWRLALAREDAYPSGLEVTILRSAFGIPPSIDETTAERERIHGKTGRLIKYYIVEFNWIDRIADRIAQLDLLPN